MLSYITAYTCTALRNSEQTRVVGSIVRSSVGGESESHRTSGMDTFQPPFTPIKGSLLTYQTYKAIS